MKELHEYLQFICKCTRSVDFINSNAYKLKYYLMILHQGLTIIIIFSLILYFFGKFKILLHLLLSY